MKHVFDILSLVHVSWIIQDLPKVAEVQRKHMLTLHNKVKMRRKAPSLAYSNATVGRGFLHNFLIARNQPKKKGQI